MGALSLSQFVDLVVGGLAVGCVYSLIALGFAMIMRATNIIHFAQGEVMMLGCKTYNKPPDYVHAQAFDAINIAIAAIERANSSDRTAVRNALRQTDHQSVRGPFKFDQKGDPTLVTHMVRIVDIKETDARS
jgi:hypothetical protein